MPYWFNRRITLKFYLTLTRGAAVFMVFLLVLFFALGVVATLVDGLSKCTSCCNALPHSSVV